MIAAAAAPPSTNGLPFNWFDMFLVVMLGFGLFRGRRNGMSKELLPALQWFVLVPVCGLVYPWLAMLLARYIRDALWNNIVSYVALALVVIIIFKILINLMAEKLVKSDFFKGGEYYLGMLAGIVRYACVLMFLLALLNAPVYTRADIAAEIARDQQNFGGGAGSGFSGSYFPHLSQIQSAVFRESCLGPRIKDYAGVLLINTDTKSKDAGGGQPDKIAPPKPKPIIKIGY